ncbi:MAG: tripartite tricarboxylate transporter TctB family protein [Clostridiaceae bacterium]|nr:tripartite tricarboxylate transporter TctB family protein [Clostridiaceae bacterium]
MEENSKKDYLHNKNIQDAVLFFILAAALMAYSLVNHYSTVKLEWKLSPYLFPTLIAVFIAALSLSLFADGKRQIKLNEKGEKKTAIHWKGVLFTIGSSIVYYGIMKILTFVPSTILFLVAMFLHLGERRIWLISLISVVCSFSIYIIFGVMLHVMLP